MMTTIEGILFWRFIQGLGSSVAFVLPAAVIFDLYEHDKAAKVMGIFNSIVTFAMSLAPIVGNYLYLTFNWRANFIFVAGLAIVACLFSIIFVHETLSKEKRVPIHLGGILKGFKDLLIHPRAMANLFIICVVCGAYFAYITNLSLTFINHLGVDNDSYAYYQAVILATFALLSFFSGKVINRLGASKTRLVGKQITFLGGVLLLLVALIAPNNPMLITAAMTVFTAGFALSLGIIFGDYMNVYPDIKGISASLSNSLRLLATSLIIGLASMTFNGTIMPVAIIVFVAGVSSLLMTYWIQRQASGR